MWCGDALNQMFPFTERAKQRLESIRCGALTRRLTTASYCLAVLGNRNQWQKESSFVFVIENYGGVKEIPN